MATNAGRALDQMVADAEESDLYERTDGPTPATRCVVAFPAFLDTCVLYSSTLLPG